MTDDSSSSSSDDDSDEKKSSKDSTAEAKTDIKKEPSPPAAAETPKTEISEYFISVLFSIWYFECDAKWFDKKLKTVFVFWSSFWKMQNYVGLSLSPDPLFIIWTQTTVVRDISILRPLSSEKKLFIRLFTDRATCEAYSFKLGSKKMIHMFMCSNTYSLS